MTVNKKLTKHGNSYALVIERPILELLGIDSDTLLEISTPDGCSIIITPIKNVKQRKNFKSALRKINKRFGRTLKNLAE
ncbi:MAG: AbrB/MazE/SpoVT family DNA-binding domain-containing protein [Chlamydiota bacterium]